MNSFVARNHLPGECTLNQVLTTVIALTLLCTIVMAGCSRRTSEVKAEAQENFPAPPPVTSGDVRLASGSPQLKRLRVAAVGSGRVPLDEVVAPGKIEANPNRIAHVVMPLAGRVRQVLIGIGDAVHQGTPVLTVDSPEIGAAMSNYRQAQAKEEEAKAALTKAGADVDRVRDLFLNRAIAQKEVLTSEAGLAQAKSALEQAQAAREESLRRLEIFGLQPGSHNQEVTVSAPLSGKVLEIGVAAGEYRNDTSAPLLTIADLSSVYMAADVPESQIRLITKGEKVEITFSAYPGEVFTGTVARIADTVDAQTRTIKVRAELKNPQGRLRPDMFGQIRHEETFRTVPLVPAGAVIQSEKDTIVYREVSAGLFRPVPVRVGKQDADRVPIIEGLSPGDRIVVDGAMLLKGL